MITITEALAEINLIKKKIDDAEVGIRTMLVRASHVPDFYQEHGGAALMITKTQQSIRDLRTRFLSIRSGISKANIENQISVNGETKTIFDWLTWKREIYQPLEKALKEQIHTLKQSAEKEAARPEVWKDQDGRTQLVSYVRNADLKTLEDEYNRIVEVYGKLDGQLSLKNATIVIQ